MPVPIDRLATIHEAAEYLGQSVGSLRTSVRLDGGILSHGSSFKIRAHQLEHSVEMNGEG